LVARPPSSFRPVLVGAGLLQASGYAPTGVLPAAAELSGLGERSAWHGLRSAGPPPPPLLALAPVTGEASPFSGTWCALAVSDRPGRKGQRSATSLSAHAPFPQSGWKTRPMQALNRESRLGTGPQPPAGCPWFIATGPLGAPVGARVLGGPLARITCPWLGRLRVLPSRQDNTVLSCWEPPRQPGMAHFTAPDRLASSGPEFQASNGLGPGLWPGCGGRGWAP